MSNSWTRQKLLLDLILRCSSSFFARWFFDTFSHFVSLYNKCFRLHCEAVLEVHRDFELFYWCSSLDWLNFDFLRAILVQRSILAESTAFYLWRHSYSKTVLYTPLYENGIKKTKIESIETTCANSSRELVINEKAVVPYVQLSTNCGFDNFITVQMKDFYW